MGVEITWMGHATFRLGGSRVVYVDPWKVASSPGDGQVVFVSHSHFDHFSAEDVQKVSAQGAVVTAPPDVISKIGSGYALRAGDVFDADGVQVTAVPAYNVGKAFHPKANGWLGAVVEMDGVRVYYAGDTDKIDEMDDLSGIDVALLPVGGTYTLDAAEAADAAKAIGCAAVIPYHFGDVVGSVADAEAFARAAGCKVHVLAAGQSVRV